MLVYQACTLQYVQLFLLICIYTRAGEQTYGASELLSSHDDRPVLATPVENNRLEK